MRNAYRSHTSAPFAGASPRPEGATECVGGRVPVALCKPAQAECPDVMIAAKRAGVTMGVASQVPRSRRRASPDTT